jgi:alkanesulfonate monooxygenase SsuD/methylene tetrahydromethanopterin reductase-like flavin-dependent oxidoreductase (luciferase family)
MARFGVEADHPAARLRDYALAVRACWDAYRKGRGRYEGEFYAIRQPIFSPGADEGWPAIPIYVAGVNPVMTAVAGEIADGFAAHMFCTPTYLERVIRPALAKGAARAKREAPPVHMPLVVGRDRASLALQMTTYTVPAYRRVLDESGLREEADAILAAIADRRRTEAARIVEDRCLDQLGVAVIDDLPERVRLWSAHADVIGLTVPWYGLDRAAQVDLFRDVLRALERL